MFSDQFVVDELSSGIAARVAVVAGAAIASEVRPRTEDVGDFFVAKWVVPDDAPLGAVRYSVTATDPQGRTGEWKPFDVAASQLTIIE